MNATEERELCLLKNAYIRLPRPHRIGWTLDLHITDRRIYATETDKTQGLSEEDLNLFTAELSQITEIRIQRHGVGKYHNGMLVVFWKTSPHLWNKEGASFKLPEDSFETARGTIPAILPLSGKVKL